MMIRLLTLGSRIAGAAFLAGAALAAATAAGAADAPAAKSASLSQAQFGGQCTEGLASGKHVMTDCSVTWTDKDGKL